MALTVCQSSKLYLYVSSKSSANPCDLGAAFTPNVDSGS